MDEHYRPARAGVCVGHLDVVKSNQRHCGLEKIRQNSLFAARATTEISSVISIGFAR